jgi:hypothetical protein
MSNNKTKFNIGIILTVTIMSAVFATTSLTTPAFSQSNSTTTTSGGEANTNSTTSSSGNATSGLLTNNTSGLNSTLSGSYSK